MKPEFPRITPMGERSILIDFEPEISENQLEKLLFYKKELEIKLLKDKVEVINTYTSLLIIYPIDIEDVYSAFLEVKEVLASPNIGKITNFQIFHLPVCYEEEFGLDLEYLSLQKRLSFKEIIKLHSTPIYRVYFIGFLPGFLYLGGLDKKLSFPRKEQPRLQVQKGAVGIGENQTGIYPQTSPGGWQIIGNCPVNIFDKNSSPPCEISAGDGVKFYAVNRDEYNRIQEEISAGVFQLKREVYERGN